MNLLLYSFESWNNRGNFKTTSFDAVHVDSRLVCWFDSNLHCKCMATIRFPVQLRGNVETCRSERSRLDETATSYFNGCCHFCLPANTREVDKTTASRPRTRKSPPTVLKHLTIGIFKMLEFKTATCLFMIPAPQLLMHSGLYRGSEFHEILYFGETENIRRFWRLETTVFVEAKI